MLLGDNRHGRDGLWKRYVYALGFAQSLVVVVGDTHRTLTHADAAPGTAIFIHIPGALKYTDAEATWFAVDGLNVGIGDDVDVPVAAHLDKLWRKYAHRAIIGRKGFVELRHPPADTGLLFDKKHLDAHLRQIEGRLDSGDSPAYNHSCFMVQYFPFLLNHRRGPPVLPWRGLSCGAQRR